ncbi:TIM-barrel domain-containing protein [Prevotella sp. LCP21S3_D2]|uniref:TIM-barrel domain-containing protein n=1 Tax=Prevotella sp. LCP21S3_D2 TaxID=3438800 RepID=UPI003F9E295D
MKLTKTLLISAVLLMSASGLQAAGFIQKGNYLTVQLKQHQNFGPSQIRLQVVSDKIIRVQATAEQGFRDKQSLIIVPQKGKANYKVEEQGEQLIITTAAMRAVLNEATGQITFYDLKDHVLLNEVAQGGKTFKPFTVPDREIGVDIAKVPESQKHGWSWRALFDSPDNEAFYGLGQHQSEELNMKGKNEDLFQYNTKVSVPFVISNKNYGILWDSYSYCRWGNPEDYLQLNRAFKLYDKDGKEGQLTGTYVDKNGQKIVRGEDSIYFEYAMPETSEICNKTDKGGIQNLPKGFALNGSKVVYEGYVEAPTNSFYQFILYYAGYMKIYIDGKLVVPERWRTAWNPNSFKFETPIRKGVKTPIRIEWQPDGDVSYCGLRVAAPRSEAEKNQLSIWSEMSPDMDYYFIAGQNLDEVISGYRTLTGKASLYPKWTLGFWQSRERYKSSKDIEENLKKFRDLKIPVDNIVQDWNYWKLDSWGSHEFEAARYPNPQAMLDSVHAMNGRFMISVWPKFYDTVKNYKEIDAKGWMYHQAIKDDIHDWLGFRGSFYDAYDAGARKMFWRQMDENLYTKYKFGIDAWWMDASEPNVRDCTPMWYRKALSGPTALGTSTEYFNAYSIVNADAIYHGQRSVNPNQRVFLLTRSGFAGEQRYSTATWSGDIATRWEDMRAQMTAGLNYSMAGLPFWGMDQGGFCVENRYVAAQQEFDKTGKENADLKEWRELQARWNQFGCFVPLYRAHGQWPLREVWNIAPANHPAYKTIVAYDKLRYRLMPYLYSMAGMVHFKDYTMMRGLVMDFNGDDNVYDIKDQWMFGPALMACPVGEYQKYSRNVYLPKQKGWYDFYTGKHYAGGQTIVADAPFDKIPVFVPEGSILPVGPEMEWSDQKKAELIDLYVYAGKDGSYTLYEDEGTNYNYEKGKYAMIDFKYNDAQKTLTIGARKGSFDGMLQKRRFNVILVNAQNNKGVNLAKAPKGKMVKYAGQAVTVKLK